MITQYGTRKDFTYSRPGSKLCTVKQYPSSNEAKIFPLVNSAAL